MTIADVTVGAQSNRILVVTAGAEENNDDCDLADIAATATYGGIALQKAETAVSDVDLYRTCNAVFYLLDPPSGMQDVVVQWPTAAGSAINQRHGGAFVIHGAAQETPTATAAAGADSAINPVSNAVGGVAAGSLVVDIITQGNVGTFTPNTTGQVLAWQQSCRSSGSATSTKSADAGGTVEMGWLHSNPRRYAQSIVAFAPAGVGATTTTSTTVPTTTTTTSTTAGPTTTTSTTSTTLAPTTTTTTTSTTLAPTTTTSTTSSTTTTTVPSGGGTVEVDATSVRSACEGFSANTITIPDFEVGAQDDRILVVTAAAEETNGDCDFDSAQASVTYGGASLTNAAAAVSDLVSYRSCSGVFYLLAPPTGIADIIVTLPNAFSSAINNRQIGAFVLHGAAQGAPEATVSTGSEMFMNPVASVINALTPGALAVDVFAQGNTGLFTPTQPGQVERWQESCSSSSAASSTLEVQAAGAQSLGWHHSNPRRYAHSIAVFAPSN